MEILPFQIYESLKRYWRRRRYQRLNGAGKRNVRVVRLGGNSRRSWRVRPIPKLRMKIPSPIKILARIRDAYMNAMLGVAGNGVDAFGGRRVPKARVPSAKAGDFESRLLFEICKSIAASRQLAAV
ncbi:uncharacterized protein LOC131235651 [Magnolia sinica]|uniref:uncharacterized protein LOC131235651 n=1 Tax=Magnolia sinica TaxID=86752 RepID=UPI002659D486|nr:uncharacterized protein LOC131235651 [Magnolia sinica]